jgi:hypothetical protein
MRLSMTRLASALLPSPSQRPGGNAQTVALVTINQQALFFN